MIIQDSLLESLIGALAVAGGTIVTGIAWIGRLGGRVSTLEKRVGEMQQRYDDTQRELMDEIKSMHADVVAVGRDLSETREESLKQFADNTDLHRLEDKVDALIRTTASIATGRRNS